MQPIASHPPVQVRMDTATVVMMGPRSFSWLHCGCRRAGALARAARH